MKTYGQAPTYKAEEQIKHKRQFSVTCISLKILRQNTGF